MFGPWTVATLLLIHVGTSDTAKEDVEQITSDCRQIADWGRQWRMWEPMYSFDLHMKGKASADRGASCRFTHGCTPGFKGSTFYFRSQIHD